MGDLLTTLTVTAVAPFLFPVNDNASQADKLFEINKPQVVAVQEVAPKKEQPKKKAQKPRVITHTVRKNDNLSVIADKYHVSWVRIWQKNTQLKHQDQLKVGQKLKIPNKNEVLKRRSPVRPLRSSVSDSSARVVQVTSYTYKTSYRSSQGGPNGYTVGWCTWWVKEKRPDIGGYWGDAGYNWISAAQSAGFSTGSAPRAGAIGVQAGHVVYVESVRGSQVYISEMGWGYRANTTPHYRTVSASEFTYIY